MAPIGNQLQTKSEQLVINALRSQLHPGELLLENFRLTDSHSGDVEIDVLVLIPNLGLAVIEVKGGSIEYRDGQWTSRTGTGSRRISPVEQARRGKHAVRNYLSRQGVTSEHLAHVDWFIAMPHTIVSGDMGPEAVADVLIGTREIPNAMQKVRERLAATAADDNILDESQVELAIALLQNQSFEASTMTLDHAASLARYGLLILAVSTFGFFVAELVWTSLVAGIWTTIVLGAFSWWAGVRFHKRHGHVPRHIVWVNIAAVLLSLGLGDGLAHIPFFKEVRGCDINYAGCVPKQPNVDCAVVRDEVEVLGEDVYGIDPDGDNVACEWHEYLDMRRF